MPYNKQYVKWQEITKDLDSLIGRNLTKIAEEMDPAVLGGDPRVLEPTGDEIPESLDNNAINVGDDPSPTTEAPDVNSDEYLLPKMSHSILNKIKKLLVKRSEDTVEVSADKLEDIAQEISDIADSADTIEDIVEEETPEEMPVEITNEELDTLQKEGYSKQQIKMYRALKQRGAQVADYIRKQASLRLSEAMKKSAVPKELEKYGAFCAQAGYNKALKEIEQNKDSIGSYFAGRTIAEMEKKGFRLTTPQEMNKIASHYAGNMVAQMEPNIEKKASYAAGRYLAQAEKNLPVIANKLAMQKIASLRDSGHIIVRDIEAERNAALVKKAAAEATERTLQELYKRSSVNPW